jgi:hypothetical protein
MSRTLHWFATPTRRWAIALPFALEECLEQWSALRRAMVRERSPEFGRDEWAYLIAFAGRENLLSAFRETFGEPAEPGAADALGAPRGPVAVWLPSNVSLLGPLTLALVSLTGSPVRCKLPAEGEDVTSPFVEFAREHLPPGPLADWFATDVRVERFGRDDERGAAFASEAAVRIAFGSDEAVAAIEALPHPAGSVGFSFGDQRSEAWIDGACADDETLRALVRVFAIYGRAGCTSPARAVLLGASADDALRVRDRLGELWEPGEVPMHVASASVMGAQLAAGLAWQPRLAARHAGVVAAGTPDLELPEGPFTLPVVAATLEEALATAPPNLQTIGHAVPDPTSERWLGVMADAGAKRFVPLARMHHFGPTWDGQGFWRGLFEERQVAA